MSVELRPLRPDEFEGWFAGWSAWYAHDLEEHGGLEADAAGEKSARDMAGAFPDGFGSPGNVLLAIQLEGERVGAIWFAPRHERGRTHAFLYSIAIDGERRGQGLGRAAMVALEDDVRERGLDRIELNVFGGNAVARGLYGSLGFAESFVSMGKDL
jgi:ribosomal protein S18 acetylase RimI-like enzyme